MWDPPPLKKIVQNEGTTCGHIQDIYLKIYYLALGNESMYETKHAGSSFMPTKYDFDA